MNHSFQKKHTSGFFYNLMPVKRHERTKFLLLCILKSLLSCAFIMLKIQKSNNIVTGQSAEQVAFVKSFVFPITLLLIGCYTALGNVLSQRKLFYAIIFFFVSLFVLYSFVLIPYGAHLSPDITLIVQRWQQYPMIIAFLNVYKYWIQLLFYCMAELFGQFFIILLFWGFANEIFTPKQAKRLYHLFIASGCLGSMVGTLILNHIAQYVKRKSQVSVLSKVDEKVVLDTISQYVGFACLGIILVVLLLYAWVLNQSSIFINHKEEVKKQKMTFVQAIKYIAANRYLMATTLLVISCAVTTSLVDITYQKYLKYLQMDSAAYSKWVGRQVLWTNFLCIIAGFFVTHRVSRHFSWKFNAYVAPAAIVFIGIVFFNISFINYNYNLNPFIQSKLHITSYRAIALLGYFQSIISVFVKYVFFDATKEMVFISLGPQARRRGKAAVDVVGSRLGKGLSSYIHMILLTIFSIGSSAMAVERVSHVLCIIFLVFGMSWFLSIQYLAPKIDEKKDP